MTAAENVFLQSLLTVDEKVRQDVTQDPLNVRLNRGPEVCQGIIHATMSVMSHNERLAIYRCLWNLSHPVSVSLLRPPGSVHKNIALLQPPLFFPQAPSLSFHPKSIGCKKQIKRFLSLSLSCIRLCLFLSFLDLNDKVISVKTWRAAHLTASHPAALTESCWGDKHYSKKWHYADELL